MMRFYRYTIRTIVVVFILAVILGISALGYLKIFGTFEQKVAVWQAVTKNISSVFHVLGDSYIDSELIPELRELRQRVEIVEGFAAFQSQPHEAAMDESRMQAALWSVAEVSESGALIRGYLGEGEREYQVLIDGNTARTGQARGVVEYRAEGLEPGRTYRVALTSGAVALGEAFFRTRMRKAPEVMTTDGSFANSEQAVLQGRVTAYGRPTRYFFEYGASPDRLDRKTDVLTVGPARTAYYRDDFELGLNRVEEQNGRSSLQYAGNGNRYYRVHLPTAFEWRPPDDHHDAVETFPSFMTKSIAVREHRGGGIADLRDALVEFDVKSQDFRPNGTELAFAIQTSLSEEQQANWAFTGRPLQAAVGPQWTRLSFPLANDARSWTYMGNNDHATKLTSSYRYIPLDAALRLHDENVYVAAFFTTPSVAARGLLDFDNFQVRYRNWSLLSEARLVRFPSGALDPGLLTDGWADEGHGWSGKAPAEFVWELARPATLRGMRIEQNFVWPATDVELSVSADGTSYSDPIRMLLPTTPPFVMSGNRFDPLFHGHDLVTRQMAGVQFVRLRILGGPREFAGLRQLSVYADASHPAPDDDAANVNIDVAWPAGQDVHYRLVAENDLGRAEGDVRKFTMPAAAVPWIGDVGLEPDPTCGGTAVFGRMSPLGSAGRYHVEVERDGDVMRTPERSTGAQTTPRHVYVRLCDLQDPSSAAVRLVVETPEGKATREARVAGR